VTHPVAGLDGFVRLSPLEFAAGWAPGHLDPLPIPRGPGSRKAVLTALEDVLLRCLAERPCVIGFSGGRDSSAILAVAVRVARREGLALPIPVTKVYPGQPAADESAWQELVVRWLGLDDWERHEYHDELDLLGPAAQESLLKHGPLWPGSAHNRGPTLRVAAGGCYVDGEGGDEILGEFRVTPLTQVMSRDRPMDRRAARQIGYALAPRLLRERVASRRLARWENRPWLLTHAREWYRRTMLRTELDLALSYRAGLMQVVRRRAVHVGMTNLDRMGREHGVRYVHPFYDPDFLTALARFGGRLGFPSRTATMRALFQDLLPDAVNARDSKALFNTAFVGQHSRRFIRDWDGSGVDPRLIDVDVLRSAWATAWVPGGTFQLLQSAWLSTQEQQHSPVSVRH
jgi:asparagine synthetase B (glutamine-hydrolysing)